MATTTQNVYLEYIYPQPGSPFASMGYWTDPGATQPWTGGDVPHGSTVHFVIGKTDKSDDFQFEAVTLWYAAEQRAPNLSVASRSYDKPHNADPATVRGISVSDIEVNPSGDVKFTIENQSSLDHMVSLGLQTTVRDHSDNKESKNQLFTTRDPQITLRGTDG